MRSAFADTGGQRSRCNSRGDADRLEKPSAQSIYYSSEAREKLAEFNVPEMLKTVAAVEREVKSIDRLMKSRLEELREKQLLDAEDKTKTDTNSLADKPKKDETRKAPTKKVTISTGK